MASLVEYHLRELDELGPELIRALKRVLSMRHDARSVRAIAGAGDLELGPKLVREQDSAR